MQTMLEEELLRAEGLMLEEQDEAARDLLLRLAEDAEAYVDAGDTELAKQDMLYDPQTSGGLLIAVHPDGADALFEELRSSVPSAQRIGTVKAYTGGARIYLR